MGDLEVSSEIQDKGSAEATAKLQWLKPYLCIHPPPSGLHM